MNGSFIQFDSFVSAPSKHLTQTNNNKNNEINFYSICIQILNEMTLNKIEKWFKKKNNSRAAWHFVFLKRSLEVFFPGFGWKSSIDWGCLNDVRPDQEARGYEETQDPLPHISFHSKLILSKAIPHQMQSKPILTEIHWSSARHQADIAFNCPKQLTNQAIFWLMPDTDPNTVLISCEKTIAVSNRQTGKKWTVKWPRNRVRMKTKATNKKKRKKQAQNNDSHLISYR